MSVKKDKDSYQEKNEGLQLKLSRKREEVDFYRTDNRNLVEEIESFETDRKRLENELADAKREIEHIKSEEYQMSIALPYTLEIQNKQERINELEQCLSSQSNKPPLEKQIKNAPPPLVLEYVFE
ncbi:Oidioi.mRNA.OKI2018_I69.XSR.g14801.t1.cds [Oikopleura dioica]|uniref:Oidioi.mRNA.OKI2018_I69.XSR.g14801.t1.cds n=1 Tax=Oikopleura dioica TaxID=34765 RepID=A0ABN7SES4_OIKDI|nr:Oidioi.mRNA.OKI2018_I69.XSR.g14801.t1.cds [Oikopleura dioica]